MYDELTELENSDVQSRQNEALGCIGCLGAETSTNWFDPMISAFSRTEPSANAKSNRNHSIQTSARAAALELYNLKPVGGESQNDLLDRIAGVYYDNRVGTGVSSATAEQVKNDPTFHTVVNLVSPLSSLKPGVSTKATEIPFWYKLFTATTAAAQSGLTRMTEAQKQQPSQSDSLKPSTPDLKPSPERGWNSLSTPVKVAIVAGVGILGIALLVTLTRPAKTSGQVTLPASPVKSIRPKRGGKGK